jgi:hypothetical protein
MSYQETSGATVVTMERRPQAGRAVPGSQEMNGATVSAKDAEANQQWWWAAEKKRSRRLNYLRKAMWKKGAIGGLYPADW